MYEAFFGMNHTPFVRDVPPQKLYESKAFLETLGRLFYVADRQMFAVVTADSGCGKSTLIRRFCFELPKFLFPTDVVHQECKRLFSFEHL